MTKKKILISVFVAVALYAGLLQFNWLSAQGDFTPLTDAQKADFAKEFKRGMGDYQELVWFDENGGKRDDFVHRYFGTYGDCFVMIRYMSRDAVGESFDDRRCPLPGLTRMVSSPVGCEIYLYNTNPKCKTDIYVHMRYRTLLAMQNDKLHWLTYDQLEQLTCDLEAWFAAGNY